MSVMDDFNRVFFERARALYNRCQYDQMSIDHWVSLVERYSEQVDELKEELEQLRETCVCGCGD